MYKVGLEDFETDTMEAIAFHLVQCVLQKSRECRHEHIEHYAERSKMDGLDNYEMIAIICEGISVCERLRCHSNL